jgi:HSP20 family molecular chaperone IbpA
MKMKLHRAQSILDQVEAVRRQVAERAFDLFKRRGGVLGRALDDWLAAERETVWKPPIEIVEKDGEFLVEAAIAGIPAKQLDVQVTPNELLVQGNGAHVHRPGEIVHTCEFRPGKLFCDVPFPRRIDPAAVRADYQDGLLRVWAPIAVDQPRSVEIR